MNDGQVTAGDLLIEHDRIARVDGQIPAGYESRGSLIKCNPAVKAVARRVCSISSRGYLREVYFADLVLVDKGRPQIVRREDVLYRCGWSPLEGDTLRSSISHTFVSGQLGYADGAFHGGPVGWRLAFDRW